MYDGYVGEIRCFAGDFEPVGWLFCDGRQLQVSDYPALYSIIGQIYGGEGASSFNLPDLRGRMIVSTGQGEQLSKRELAEKGGDEEVLLDVSQIPSHSHAANYDSGKIYSVERDIEMSALMQVNNSSGDKTVPGGNFLAADGSFAGNYSADTDKTTLHEEAISFEPDILEINNLNVTQQPEFDINYSGNSEPHENMPPYIVLNFLICVEPPYFPQRS